MTKKTSTQTEPKAPKKVKDKGAEAAKKAMTPPPLPVPAEGAEIIPINAGGPAMAAQAVPAKLSLLEMAKRWSDAKRMEAQGKREAESYREQMIGTFEKPELAIGTKNDFVDIKPDTDVAWDDPKLHTFLKERGWFEALCKPPALDTDKVKSKALTEPELETLIASLTTKKPKFFQVKDKAEKKEDKG